MLPPSPKKKMAINSSCHCKRSIMEVKYSSNQIVIFLDSIYRQMLFGLATVYISQQKQQGNTKRKLPLCLEF